METIGIIFSIISAIVLLSVLLYAVIYFLVRMAKGTYEYFSEREYKQGKLPLWEKKTVGETYFPIGYVIVKSKDKNGCNEYNLGFFKDFGDRWELWHFSTKVAAYERGTEIEIIYVDKFTTKKQRL